MGNIKDFFINSSVEKVFLYTAAPIILLFIMIIPAFQGWDETTHFLRAYQISEGHLVSQKFGNKHAGGMMPINIVQMTDTAVGDLVRSAQSGLKQKAHLGYYRTYLSQTKPSSMRVQKYFESSAVYSPITYIPQSLGIFLARLVHLPLLFYDYIGRLFNAVAFLALVYFGIRLSPKGKWVLLAVAMLPTCLTVAATFSPDALIDGGAVLLMGMFLNLLFNKKPASSKKLLSIALALVLISLTKQAYFVLGFLFLFIPPKAFGSLRRYLSWNAVFVLLSVGTTLGWYLAVSGIAQNISIENRPNANINPHQQLSYILSHPVRYAEIFFWQVVGNFNAPYISMVGFFTWKGVLMPQYFILASYLSLIGAYMLTFTENLSMKMSLLQRRATIYGTLATGFLALLVIYTSLYLGFSDVGQNRIEGIQGRYLTPLLLIPLPAIALMKKNSESTFSLNEQKTKLILASVLIGINVVAMIIIFATNYIPHIQFV